MPRSPRSSRKIKTIKTLARCRVGVGEIEEDGCVRVRENRRPNEKVGTGLQHRRPIRAGRNMEVRAVRAWHYPDFQGLLHGDDGNSIGHDSDKIADHDRVSSTLTILQRRYKG